MRLSCSASLLTLVKKKLKENGRLVMLQKGNVSGLKLALLRRR